MPHCRADRFRQRGVVGKTVPQPSEEAFTFWAFTFICMTEADNPFCFPVELLIIFFGHKLVIVHTAQTVANQPQAENNGNDT